VLDAFFPARHPPLDGTGLIALLVGCLGGWRRAGGFGYRARRPAAPFGGCAVIGRHGRPITGGARYHRGLRRRRPFDNWRLCRGLQFLELFFGGFAGASLGGEGGDGLVTREFSVTPLRLRFAQGGLGVTQLASDLLARMALTDEPV
jgi:hypothetical protein